MFINELHSPANAYQAGLAGDTLQKRESVFLLNSNWFDWLSRAYVFWAESKHTCTTLVKDYRLDDFIHKLYLWPETSKQGRQ